MAAKAVKYGMLHGVEDDGAIIYDPTFRHRKTARRVAQMENWKDPPETWEETRAILESEGLWPEADGWS